MGFDLHKRYITACAMDASGAIIAEFRQLSTALEAVLTWLGALPGPVTVGMEATLYWEWLATELPRLVLTEEARALQGRLLQSAGLPARAALDALHVAVAAVHEIEYLLTWNVRHIANAETRRRVEAICRAEGYRPSVLCTPEELLGGADDSQEELR